MAHFRTLSEISYELAKRIPLAYAKGPIFFLAQTDKEAKQLLTLCRYWDASFPDDVIISQLYMTEHLLTKAQFSKLTLELKPGLHLPISDITNRLSQMGFERFPRAVAARSFAVRGNVVDIIGRTPMRLEYDGNTISQINLFNPSTQASAGKLFQLTVWPYAYAEHLPLWHEGDLTYQFVTPKYYHKRYSVLKQDVAQYLSVQVATQRAVAVRDLLPTVKLTPALRNIEGFALPSEHFLFLTDEHIFGQEEQITTFANPIEASDLEPGDYVVHIDHGVGLFETMVEHDGEPYFELHYLNKDKLLVPLSSANRIEKYVGQAQPKLTRLSGTQWETIVHKVQEDVRHTARELLEMHAQRNLAKTNPLPLTLTPEEHSISNDVPFELTPDQAQSLEDIIEDLNREQPMDRLLCGDVGFGKTEVALRAALHTVLHGGQVVVLAPTTILAQQHLETFTERLEKYGVTVGGLSRLTTASEQAQVVKKLKAGKIDIVIGTHRLLSSDIAVPKLELIVIDEEQRFGVLHKERLKALRQAAHVLTMTATPIPRTLNLALSGLRDISVLNTAPPQRLGVTTVIEEFNAEMELEAIREELERAGQVYVVHNNLTTIYARASFIQQHLPQARLAIAHGKLSATDLIHIMRQFHAGEIDVLVASTIIENGLDITNANTLIVEHAERFGLAQLYQLRGRIGRGAIKAYAYLFYTAERLTKQGKDRLRALHTVKELGGGFELAMKDLEIRGVGDILGKKQHGHVQQIGLNLYSRLLQQAISQLEQE